MAIHQMPSMLSQETIELLSHTKKYPPTEISMYAKIMQ